MRSAHERVKKIKNFLNMFSEIHSKKTINVNKKQLTFQEDHL